MKLSMKPLKRRKRAGGVNKVNSLVTIFCLALFLLMTFVQGAPAQTKSMLGLWEEETSLLLNQANDTQRREFEIMMAANGAINSIQHIQKTLFNGTSSCAQNNPEIQAEIKKAYTHFEDALDKPLRKAAQNLNMMVRAQSLTSTTRMRNYIDLTNKVAVEKDNEINWVPVTSLNDCRKLTKKMKDNVTINKLIAVLNEDYGVKR